MKSRRDLPETFRRFVSCWDEPFTERRVARGRDDAQFFILRFDAHAVVCRFVTCGLAGFVAADGRPVGHELLFVVGHHDRDDLGSGRIETFLADLAANHVHRSFRPAPGSTLPDTSLAPWGMSAIIFDDPLGEPEGLEAYRADGVDARVLWAIPAHREEAALVVENGIEAFDRLISAQDLSLADVRRPSFVPPASTRGS